MIKKQPEYREFKEYLLEKLKNPERAFAYLNAAFDDEDERVFLLALKNVLEAQGGDMTAVAKEAQLTRQSLHKILSKKGNPRLTSLRSVLHVLGYDLAIRSFKNR